MPVCVNGLTSPSSCVGDGGAVCGHCLAARRLLGGSKRLASPAGRDRTTVDCVADGPQRGGEGDAIARSRPGCRPQRESESQLQHEGPGGTGMGSVCPKAPKLSLT